MADKRELLVRINGDTSGLEKAFGKTTKEGGRLSGAFDKVKDAAKFLAVGVGVAAGAATVFGKSSVDAYNASLEASAKLRTNLLNVKGATEQNVQSLEKLAAKLQGVGVIEDDVIKAGMSQLATFNLQGKTIETLTPKITDMVAQLKGHNATAEDMVTINNLVGKVMTGNVGALSRYGVTLSDNQKELLKQGTEAQRAAVLNEVLAQNYGKVNEALRNTPQGQLTALKNTWGDFQELIGEFVSNLVTPLVGGMNSWFQSMGGPEGVLKAIKENLIGLRDAAWPVITAIGDYLGPKFDALNNSVKDFLPTAERLWHEVMQPLAKFLGEGFVFALGLVIDGLNLVFESLRPIINFMLDNKGVVLGFAAAFTILKGTLMIWDLVDKLRVSFEVLRLVTIPQTIASLGTLQTALVGFTGFAVFAAVGVGAFIAIQDSISKTKKALNELDSAMAAADKSNDQAIRKLQQSATAARERGDTKEAARIGNVIRSMTARALGGPVTANMPYLVGERGPELFIPSNSGNIASNSELRSQAISGGQGGNEGPAVQINFSPTLQVGMFAGMPTEFREISERLWVEFTRIAKTNGINLQPIGARGQ